MCAKKLYIFTHSFGTKQKCKVVSFGSPCVRFHANTKDHITTAACGFVNLIVVINRFDLFYLFKSPFRLSIHSSQKFRNSNWDYFII